MALEGTAKNLVIASRNWVDDNRCIIGGPGWLPSLPLANMKDNKLSRVARSTGADALRPYFLTDLGISAPTSLVSFPKHNLSDGSRWRLRAFEERYRVTSGSTVAIGTGSKAFSIGAGLSISPFAASTRTGCLAVIRRTSAPDAAWMMGQVASYSGGTLTVAVDTAGGGGSFSDWTVYIVDLDHAKTLRYDSRPILGMTTSATAASVAVGAKTFLVSRNVYFYANTEVRIERTSNPGTFMLGDVVSFDPVAGVLSVNVQTAVGAGTFGDWTITRLAENINVWPEIQIFTQGGFWGGEYAWGGRLLLGESYAPPAVHYLPLVKGPPEQAPLPAWYGAQKQQDPIYGRFWLTELFDDAPANTSGFVQIGRLILSPAWQPSVNASYGWALRYVDPSPRSRARGGQVYVDPRSGWRRLTFSITGMSRNEVMGRAYEIDRELGVRKPLLVIFDPMDAPNMHRLTIYGSQVETTDIGQPAAFDDVYEKTFIIEEWP